MDDGMKCFDCCIRWRNRWLAWETNYCCKCRINVAANKCFNFKMPILIVIYMHSLTAISLNALLTWITGSINFKDMFFISHSEPWGYREQPMHLQKRLQVALVASHQFWFVYFRRDWLSSSKTCLLILYTSELFFWIQLILMLEPKALNLRRHLYKHRWLCLFILGCCMPFSFPKPDQKALMDGWWINIIPHLILESYTKWYIYTYLSFAFFFLFWN